MAKSVPIKRGDVYFIPPIPGYSESLRELPAVTTILDEVKKEAITNWKIRSTAEFCYANPGATMREAFGAQYKKSGEATLRGKTVHSWIQAYEKGAPLAPEELPEDIRPYGLAFEKYVDRFHPRSLQLGETLANLTYGYGGTLDSLLVDASGRTMLVDWKTGKAIYPEHRWQLSAYRRAEWILVREGIETIAYPMPKVDGAMIVLLKPDGGFAIEEFADDFETFLAYKHIWHTRYSGGKPCPDSCFCHRMFAPDLKIVEEVAADVVGG